MEYTKREKWLTLITCSTLVFGAFLAISLWTIYRPHLQKNPSNICNEEIHINLPNISRAMTTKNFGNCTKYCQSESPVECPWITTPGQHRRQTEQDNLIFDYPYVVAIVTLTYVDNPTVFNLLCMGVIIGKREILTTNGCNKKSGDWSGYQVRSMSNYWCKGGIVHNIGTIYEGPNNLVILHVYPDLNIQKFVQIVDKPLDISIHHLNSVIWETNDREHVHLLKKHSPLSVIKIESKLTNETTEEQENINCSKFDVTMPGQPIILDGSLLAIYSGVKCTPKNISPNNNQISGVQLASIEIVDWIQSVFEDAIVFKYIQKSQLQSESKMLYFTLKS